MEYDVHTALIVVDVQNDFADDAGSLAVAGGSSAIVFINEQVDQAIEQGATIAYTQDWHPPSTPHFAKDGGIWPTHCVADSWGSELHPSLRVAADAIRIHKGSGGEDGYSGFTVRDPVTGTKTPTGLEDLLRERSIGRVAVLGLATDYCVLETTMDAIHAGFETTLLADGVRAVNLTAGDGARAVAAMANAGALVE